MCLEHLPLQFHVSFFLPVSQNFDIVLQVFDSLLALGLVSHKFAEFKRQIFLTILHILLVWREEK